MMIVIYVGHSSIESRWSLNLSLSISFFLDMLKTVKLLSFSFIKGSQDLVYFSSFLITSCILQVATAIDSSRVHSARSSAYIASRTLLVMLMSFIKTK